MEVKYVIQTWYGRKYQTTARCDNEEQAKRTANKPYITRDGTATTRVIRITRETIHTFRRKPSNKHFPAIKVLK